MENRIYFAWDQDDFEAHLLFNMGKDEIMDYCKPAQEKIHESDDPETEKENKKGTRHPSDRKGRQRKTDLWQKREKRMLRAREARKIPYSALVPSMRGKRHDHLWVDEKSIPETRSKAKWKSEIRDFWNKAEMPEEREEYKCVYTPSYATYDEYMVDYWFNRTQVLRKKADDQESYIHFLENRVRELEREIGF